MQLTWSFVFTALVDRGYASDVANYSNLPSWSLFNFADFRCTQQITEVSCITSTWCTESSSPLSYTVSTGHVAQW